MKAVLLSSAYRIGTCTKVYRCHFVRGVICFLAAICFVVNGAMGTVIHVPDDQPTIQEGINASVDGDTVLVAPGTYVENINFTGKNIVVVSHFILEGDTDFIETTIIDGSNPSNPDSASCVVMCSGEDSSAVLQGFTLTGGRGTRWYDDLHSQMFWRAGGGVLTYKSSPTIRDNIIAGNIVTNTANVGGAQGGGFLCYEGNPHILSNVICENEAGYGAGFVTDYSGALIEWNIICRNAAGPVYGGGGYYAIGNGPAPIILEHNTIVDNSCESNGGAITLYGAGIIVNARNNIIWGNTQNQGGQISGTPIITYSDVEGGYPGEGNIDTDPLFEDDDYNLSQNSPCIDSGDPDSPLDPDGTRADMGARVYPLFDAPLIRFSESRVDDSQWNNNGRADADETVELIVTFSNSRLDATGVSATLTTDDPDVQIIQGTADYPDLPRDGNADNEDDPFSFSVSSEAVAHRSMFYLDITADGGYEATASFELIIGTTTILLVDDDGGDVYEGLYTEALRTQEVYPIVWHVSESGSPMMEVLQEYEAVIWSTGNDRESSLTGEEQSAIAGFLDGGGNLLIAGSNIGYDLVEDGTVEDATFYANYLHAEYLSDSNEETFLCGIDGDPISGEFTFLPLDENETSPSVIAPREGSSTVLVYQISREAAAIKYDGDHKIVYFAVGLEGVRAMSGSNDEVRGTLLKNALQWFSYVPSRGDVNQDGGTNILDVLAAVNIILGVMQPSPSQIWAADCSGDGTVDIIDALGIVNVVLGTGECSP